MSWKPELPLEAGERYTWTVQAVSDGWKGPPASACFEFPFLRGDSNSDKKVDVSDAVALLEHLFAGDPAPRPLEAGDFNGSGNLDISDAIYLLTFLFLGGPPPPPPFPAPGLLP